jgi:CheY-like chemotaxis protein
VHPPRIDHLPAGWSNGVDLVKNAGMGSYSRVQHGTAAQRQVGAAAGTMGHRERSLAEPDTSAFTLMVVDDSEVFRGATRSLVERLPGFDLVAEASSGREALAQFADASPDLVLMDIRMSGIDGIEATRQIVHRWPTAVIVLITSEDPGDVPASAECCGAVRIMQKESLCVSSGTEWRELVLARRSRLR